MLGSGSARRKELLAQIGVVPDQILSPDIDETPSSGELPAVYCARMAREKVKAIQARADDVVLCADTTVALGRRILGKPEHADDANAFLRALSGRRHRVITSVAVKSGERLWEKSVTSAVRMKSLSRDEIRSYVDSNDWVGKAGGYGIQGPAAAFIPWISGSYSGIVGLPLAETANLLRAAGYRWSW